MSELLLEEPILLPSGIQRVIGITEDWRTLVDGSHFSGFNKLSSWVLATIISKEGVLVPDYQLPDLAISFLKTLESGRAEIPHGKERKVTVRQFSKAVGALSTQVSSPIRSNVFRVGLHSGASDHTIYLKNMGHIDEPEEKMQEAFGLAEGEEERKQTALNKILSKVGK